jgi:hypothetical protein
MRAAPEAFEAPSTSRHNSSFVFFIKVLVAGALDTGSAVLSSCAGPTLQPAKRNAEKNNP